MLNFESNVRFILDGLVDFNDNFGSGWNDALGLLAPSSAAFADGSSLYRVVGQTEGGLWRLGRVAQPVAEQQAYNLKGLNLLTELLDNRGPARVMTEIADLPEWPPSIENPGILRNNLRTVAGHTDDVLVQLDHSARTFIGTLNEGVLRGHVGVSMIGEIGSTPPSAANLILRELPGADDILNITDRAILLDHRGNPSGLPWRLGYWPHPNHLVDGTPLMGSHTNLRAQMAGALDLVREVSREAKIASVASTVEIQLRNFATLLSNLARKINSTHVASFILSVGCAAALLYSSSPHAATLSSPNSPEETQESSLLQNSLFRNAFSVVFPQADMALMAFELAEALG